MANILILYYSRRGSVRNLARGIAGGVESVAQCTAVMRTVPAVSMVCQSTAPSIPPHGDVYVDGDDLENCDGLILGSPTRFGAMAAPLNYFLQQTAPLWLSGALAGKPGAVFTSSGSMHGGNESVLLSMMLPLIHHGMVLVGIPYAGTQLAQTTSGGSPYGASHYAGETDDLPIDAVEQQLAETLGRRVAQCACALGDALRVRGD